METVRRTSSTRTFLAGFVVACVTLIAAAGGSIKAHVAEPTPIALQAEGCQWLQANGGNVMNQGEQVLSCILTNVLTGNLNPLSLGAICGGVALEDVFNDLKSLLAFYTQPSEGGALMCGSGKALFPGQPSCVDLVALGPLRVARDTAELKLGAQK